MTRLSDRIECLEKATINTHKPVVLIHMKEEESQDDVLAKYALEHPSFDASAHSIIYIRWVKPKHNHFQEE